ncbi:hypothetical protein DXG03_001178 [Asterophora parasitica]|uniref:Uncharacterized protein n=1 Tax=Asterophora parasitica TaxID=117018 RepID=A0A9P7G4D7_9AGAR|nr:hypothetical protein DXG03_001178 [Asterophora parasitica]
MSAQRPSLLTPDANPLELLCRHFNVSKPVLPPHTTDLPPTITLSPLTRTSLPTHVLAVSPSTPASNAPIPAPILVPIDATLYSANLRVDFPAQASEIPTLETSSTATLALPLLPIAVPHPPTLALLLLFALGLEPVPPYHLLPMVAVEEFPNQAAMAQVLARTPGLTELVRRNEGLWKNVLALGVRKQSVVDTVGMVWGVTAEARRLRLKAASSAAPSGR